MTAGDVKLGGERFPCETCGGKRGHVPHCQVQQREWWEERDRDARRSIAYRAEQDARRAALTGVAVRAVRVDYGMVIDFENGARLVGKLTGGEMAGHGESWTSSLDVTVLSPDEVAANVDAWHAFYDRWIKEHGR